MFLAACAKARDNTAYKNWKNELRLAGYSTEVPFSEDSPALISEADNFVAQLVNPDASSLTPGLIDKGLNPITKPIAKKTHSSLNLFSEEERNKRLRSSNPALAEAPHEQSISLQSPPSEDKEVSAQPDKEVAYSGLFSLYEAARFLKFRTDSKRSFEDDTSTSKRGKPYS